MNRRRQLLAAVVLCATLSWSAVVADGPLHEQIAEATRQLEAHPDDTALLLRRGELHRLHNQWAEARADYQRVQKLAPTDSEPLFRLGRLALDEDKAGDAVALLERFVTRQPERADGQIFLARALARSNRPAEAVTRFTRALALADEPRPEWFAERCHAQIVLPGDHVADALAGLDEGIAKLGPLPALQLEAIDLEVRRHDFAAALRRLDIILAASERKERWLLQRGDLLSQAGRTNEARTAWFAARDAYLALDPRKQRALAMLDFRRELEARLAALPPASATPAHRD